MDELLRWARIEPKIRRRRISRKHRRNDTAIFKAKVALEAVKGDKTIAEAAQKHDVHPNQVAGHCQLLERAADVSGAGGAAAEPAAELKGLHAKIGQQGLHRKPNTSRKSPAHPVFPYLLRDLAIERANQVWALNITYIPMARGWVYLVAVLERYSRRVLAHRVSITMEADFCMEALCEAAARSVHRSR